MPIWRSPGLEAVFGSLLDSTGISDASITRLVAEATRESDQLDFKQDLWRATHGPRPPWTEEQEFAKDVAAFANQRGGVILVGVQESGGTATGVTPIPAAVSHEQEERRLRQALVNHQAPLAACDFVPVPAKPDGWYLAVVIPPSPRSPHAVQGGDPRNPLRYPIRHGSDTVWLTEHEVAERYRRRLTAQQDEQIRVEKIVADGSGELGRADGVWLYVAAVPEVSVAGRLDERTVREIDAWRRHDSLVSPLNRSLPAYGRGIPAPGKVAFTGSLRTGAEDETQIREAYLELHVDGAAFAARPAGKDTADESDNRQLGEMTLVDDGILLVDMVTRWCAYQAGGWGTATIIVGLVDAGVEGGGLGKTVELANSAEGGFRRIPGTRRLNGRPRSTATADLAALDTQQRRLVLQPDFVILRRGGLGRGAATA
jgi:hypothetical protein